MRVLAAALRDRLERLVKERALTWRGPSLSLGGGLWHFLLAGMMAANVALSCWPVPVSIGFTRMRLRTSDGEGCPQRCSGAIVAVGCLCVGWSFQCLRCMCLCSVRKPCVSLLLPLGTGGWNLGSVSLMLLGLF